MSWSMIVSLIPLGRSALSLAGLAAARQIHWPKTNPLIFLCAWRSKKLGRKAASSMLCETLALSKGSENLLWFQLYLQSLQFGDFDVRLKARRSIANSEKYVLKRDNPRESNPSALMIIDAKSLYDALKSEQTLQEDRRAALEIAVLKDDMAMLKALARWIPHNLNPADGLTKHIGAHLEPLMELLRSHKLCLFDESQVLQEHSILKEQFGYLPRSKGTK